MDLFASQQLVHRRRPRRAGALVLCALVFSSGALPLASGGWTQESALADVLLNGTPVVRVAGDPDTLLVAAWHQTYDYTVWIAHSTAGGPWSAPIKSARSQYSLGSLDVAVAPTAGVAIVTWSESVSSYYIGPLKAAIYTTSGGWAAPVNIDAGGAAIVDAHGAIDASGNIVVVWAQSASYVNTAWGRSYTVGGGWGAITRLDSGGSPYQARVGASPSGVFTAAWSQAGRLYARPFTFTAGWGNASGPLDANYAYDPVVAVSADATSVIAWREYSTNPASVWATRNPQGLGWQGPIRFADASNGTLDLPLLSAGGGGNATLYWLGARGGTVHLLASRITAGGGWSPTFAIDAGATPVIAARIVSAAGGIMRAVWTQGDSSSVTVWSAGQDSAGVWGVSELVECRLPAANSPDVALAPSGRAVATWAYNEWGAYKPWWNWFDNATAGALGPLVVSAPSQGASVESSSVWVAGIARSDATLTVNGQAVAVGANGSFGALVNLAPGPNALGFSLTMPCGQTRAAWVNVTYQAPSDLGSRIDALEAELNATVANVTAAWAAIFAVQADIQATRGNVSSAQAQLSALDARLTALAAQAAAQGSALDVHAAELAMLNASLESAAARLGAAEARLALAEGGVASLQASSTGANASVALLWTAVGGVRNDLNATSAQLTDARLNLSRLDGQVSALQATGGTGGVQGAGAESSFAVTLMAVAIAAVAVGLLLGRRGGRPPQAARDARPLAGPSDGAKDDARAPAGATEEGRGS
jgi:hypothetical protein